jgi:hypothetical protein
MLKLGVMSRMSRGSGVRNVPWTTYQNDRRATVC